MVVIHGPLAVQVVQNYYSLPHPRLGNLDCILPFPHPGCRSWKRNNCAIPTDNIMEGTFTRSPCTVSHIQPQRSLTAAGGDAGTRYDHAMVTYGGDLFVFGGRSAETAFCSNELQ